MATSSTSSSQEVSTEKRPVPLQLRQVSSCKGRKYTQSQLAAMKPRVKLTLKQKSEIVNEAKKMEFQVDKMGTLAYVNQTLLVGEKVKRARHYQGCTNSSCTGTKNV